MMTESTISLTMHRYQGLDATQRKGNPALLQTRWAFIEASTREEQRRAANAAALGGEPAWATWLPTHLAGH